MGTRLVVGSVLLVATLTIPAAAHFKLISPDSLANQSSALGDPQKTEPCGQDDGNPPFVTTGIITDVPTGSMLPITIDETFAHEGHFRIALAADMNSLPADPPVTPTAQDDCDSTVIQTNPVLPVLADGLLPHVTGLQGTPTMMVQLPAGMECPNCVLQVVQYMRKHGSPCFYHHCATVNISDNAPPLTDGAPQGDDGGVDPVGGDDGGGCCSSTRDAPSAFVLGLLVVGLLARRRRR